MAILRKQWILILLTVLGALFHFYNLSWGAPLFFHPDERNIANAVTQLQLPHQLNPNFFAYGSLPIYVIFFTGLLFNFFSTFDTASFTRTLPFADAIMVSRFYSALFATLLIPLVYIIGKKLQDKTTGIAAAFLATFSTGFIQFAHFGTFEMWLTLFSVLLFWSCIEFIKEQKLRYVFLFSLFLGMLLSIKISSLALIPLPLLTILVGALKSKKKSRLKRMLFALGSLFILILICICVFVLTNPYVFLDTKAFLASMEYESSVGLNTLPVFYTQGFYDTIPILYQFIHIYPFLLNPIVTIVFVFSFVFIAYQATRTRNVLYIVLIAFYIILFLSQAILFIKWTRYMIPTLPFIFLIVGITFPALASVKPQGNYVHQSVYTIAAVACVVFGVSYFITAFVQPDTRTTAVEQARKLFDSQTAIVTEPYDLGTTAFQRSFANISEFNTYDTDAGSPMYTIDSWNQTLSQADVVILPSQRVLQPRMQNPKQFPNGYKIYSELLDGTSGYQKVYETPCDIFCNIAYLGDPIYHFEQTAYVFDRPTVMIFRKLYNAELQ